MSQKVKILSKYSIDAIDGDFELKKAQGVLKTEVENLGVSLDEIKVINSKTNRTEEEEFILSEIKGIEERYTQRVSEIEQYKELKTIPVPQISELDLALPFYEEKEGVIEMFWEIVSNDSSKIRGKIVSLKKELADSDYKVIKCYESSLLSQELPYDLETVISEREQIRIEINRLESLISDDFKNVELL